MKKKLEQTIAIWGRRVDSAVAAAAAAFQRLNAQLSTYHTVIDKYPLGTRAKTKGPN